MDFKTFRNYYILTSQILGALFSSYFLLNLRHYEVSWCFLAWAFPNITLAINTMLSSVGTLILIIPLTIIIMSIVIPESYKLRIISMFLGTASTLFLLISGFANNTLGEVYNMRIFLITKILTLEEKQEIFKTEYSLLLENYRDNLRLFNNLSQFLLEKYFTIYNTKLAMLKEKLAIKLYANEVLEANAIKLQGLILHEKYTNFTEYAKYGVYLAGIAGLCLIAFAVVRAFMDTNVLLEGAKLAKDTAVLAAAGNENLLCTQEAAQQGFLLTKELCLELLQVAMEAQSKATETAFQKVWNKIASLELGLNDVTDILKKP